jgi:HEAT repeat protein
MISSTTEDLVKEREIVDRAIKSFKFERYRAESMGSISRSPREVCEQMARDCDLLVLITGERYGWIIPDLGVSVTHREFEVARLENPKKILVYVKDVITREKGAEDFLHEVTEFSTGYFRRVPFKSLSELEEGVKEDMALWISERILAHRVNHQQSVPPSPIVRLTDDSVQHWKRLGLLIDADSYLILYKSRLLVPCTTDNVTVIGLSALYHRYGIWCWLAQVGRLEFSTKLLAEASQRPEHPIRIVAARCLGLIKGEEPTRRLVEMISDSHGSVRLAALESLGSGCGPEGVREVISLIRAWHPGERPRIVRALVNIGTQAAQAALLAIASSSDEEWGLRSAAAQGYLAIGGELAGYQLLELAATVPHAERWEAAALGKLADPRRLERLHELAKHRGIKVRIQATEALGQMNSQEAERILVSQLADKEWQVRLATVEALGKLNRAGVASELLQIARTESEAVTVKWAAIKSVAGILGRQALTELQQLSRSREHVLRAAAAESLAVVGGDSAFAIFKPLLADVNLKVRKTAVASLTGFGTPGAHAELLSLLRDPVWEIRELAAKGLAKLGGENDIEPLLALMHDNQRVKTAAAETLFQIDWGVYGQGIRAESLHS